MANSAASAFSRQGEYANSPGNRAYCYAELAISPEVECELCQCLEVSEVI